MDNVYYFLWVFWEAIHPRFSFLWNVFLALVPLSLSLLLFRGNSRQTLIWWVGIFIFIAFLPNSPYVLTDISHFFARIYQDPPLPLWSIILFSLPQYTLYLFFGFQAYVISLTNLSNYLRYIGKQRWILPTELLLHYLCSIGIFLGRVERFNSWELLTKPKEILAKSILDLSDYSVILSITGAFIILSGLYRIFREFNLAIIRVWPDNILVASVKPKN